MGIQNQGFSGVISDVDGITFRAQKVTTRPLEYGIFGHYRLATTVALVAAQAANATLFAFRWTDTGRLCIPMFIRLECIQTSAATATIMPSFEVVLFRASTVADSGGSQVLVTANAFKKRTSMGTTLVNDIRKSTVAAGLTVGTRTTDVEAIMQLPTNQAITTPNAATYRKELDFTNSGDMPLVLAANEGFIVRGPSVVFGAAGTANLLVEVAWAEAVSY